MPLSQEVEKLGSPPAPLTTSVAQRPPITAPDGACIRLPALSNTMLCSDSKYVPVTSIPSCHICRPLSPMVALPLWNVTAVSA